MEERTNLVAQGESNTISIPTENDRAAKTYLEPSGARHCLGRRRTWITMCGLFLIAFLLFLNSSRSVEEKGDGNGVEPPSDPTETKSSNGTSEDGDGVDIQSENPESGTKDEILDDPFILVDGNATNDNSSDDDEDADAEPESRRQPLNGLNWYQSFKKLTQFETKCTTALANPSLSPAWRGVFEADCGVGYQTRNISHKVWRVALIGDLDVRLSGCSFGTGVCRYNPMCQMYAATHEAEIQRADVVVVHASQHQAIESMKLRNKQIRVLYWREAYWSNLPPLWKQKKFYDLEMGVHGRAALRNPNFRVQPGFLMQGVFQNEKKSGFAISLISDCQTSSHRQSIIDHLVRYLGADKVHQYGKCGTMELPGHSIWAAMQFVAKYKFFLAFENTIQTGYSTEKLFWSLLLPVIPVYYGDPGAPNITRTPSHLRVLDYPDIKSLADHMRFLDANPEEYAKYHTWRTDPSSFTKEYLDDMARNFPGPSEVKMNLYRPSLILSPRKAICCRLCDETFLRSRMVMRTDEDLVRKTYKFADVARSLHMG